MRKILLVCLLLLPLPALAEPPRVVVSIAPLAGIAAAVMDGVGVPDVLVQGNASPHTYQLRPGDARRLERADLVLWVGAGLETFLTGPLAALTRHSRLIELDHESSLTHLPAVPDGDEDGHDHPGSTDPHLWLDPRNAVAIAGLLAGQLGEIDPVHADLYVRNANRFAQQLAGLDADFTTILTPLRSRRLAVFHDAWQYFVHHYQLDSVGAIVLSPDVPPTAARLQALRRQLQTQQVVCVLAEPQFRDDVVDMLIEGTGARKGLANPDASDPPVTPGLYFTYLERAVTAFADCLKGPEGASSVPGEQP